MSVHEAFATGFHELTVGFAELASQTVQRTGVVATDLCVSRGHLLQHGCPVGQVEFGSHSRVTHLACAQVIQKVAQSGLSQFVIRRGARRQICQRRPVFAHRTQAGLEFLDQHASQVATVRGVVHDGVELPQLDLEFLVHVERFNYTVNGPRRLGRVAREPVPLVAQFAHVLKFFVQVGNGSARE